MSTRSLLLLPAAAGLFLGLVLNAPGLVDARTRGKDAYYFLSAYLNHSDPLHRRCGPQQIDSWAVEDQFYAHQDGTRIHDPMAFYPNTGIFRAPVGGFYHACYAFRVSQNSSADFAIYEKNANLDQTHIVTAFGTRAPLTSDWIHVQKCFNVRMARNNTLWVRLESGGANDCIEDTEWKYGRFDIFLYGPTVAQPHD